MSAHPAWLATWHIRRRQLRGWRAETFTSAHAFLSRSPATEPGCLILEVSLPDFSGLDLQRHISREHRGLPIIFVTNLSDTRRWNRGATHALGAAGGGVRRCRPAPGARGFGR